MIVHEIDEIGAVLIGDQACDSLRISQLRFACQHRLNARNSGLRGRDGNVQTIFLEDTGIDAHPDHRERWNQAAIRMGDLFQCASLCAQQPNRKGKNKNE